MLPSCRSGPSPLDCIDASKQLRGLRIKTIYLTGAPAAGKSSTVARLVKACSNIEVWEYGARLCDHITGKQSGALSHEDLRSSSASIVHPDDIAEVDKLLIDFVVTLRSSKHLIIDSHPVTKEDYGFRCTAFSLDQIRSIKPDEIWVLYTDPETTIRRIENSNGGRKRVTEEEARMHTSLQASVASNYGILVGCPVYFFDTNADQDGLVRRLIGRLKE